MNISFRNAAKRIIFAVLPLIILYSVCKSAPWIMIGGAPSRWIYVKSGSLPSGRAKLLGESASVLCFTGAKIRFDGRVFVQEQKGEIESLVATGKKVYLLLTPYTRDEGERLLKDPSARAHAAHELAKLCDARGLSGMHLDFEFLHPSYAQYYADFAKELRKALDGRDLTVAVFPPVGMGVSWSGMYDLARLGKSDGVVLMCYDLHNRGTERGPVTDAQWAEKNIIESLKSVPAEKLWLGVPLYGYLYDTQGNASYVTMRKGMEYLSRAKFRRLPGGVTFAWIRLRDEDYALYLPDPATIKILERLSVKYKLAGVAYWRAGFESDGFWR
ncbi:MAG TPA: glycosyl hydrolase family 18 protein [Spirochaetota bacterium]